MSVPPLFEVVGRAVKERPRQVAVVAGELKAVVRCPLVASVLPVVHG